MEAPRPCKRGHVSDRTKDGHCKECMAIPEIRAKRIERCKLWNSRQSEEYHRKRYHTEPEYRASRLAASRVYQTKYRDDPVRKAIAREAQREWRELNTTPEYRAAQRLKYYVKMYGDDGPSIMKLRDTLNKFKEHLK
jgi:hypothetical protein